MRGSTRKSLGGTWRPDISHVREGKDFDDAIGKFVNAHVNTHKPLTWYDDGHSHLTATLEYVVLARELWQALADDWVPDGVIKIPARSPR